MQQNRIRPDPTKIKDPQLVCRPLDVNMSFQRVLQTANEEVEERPENWRL